MRPQKLTLKNFMPFRVADGLAHEVDFSPLDLFAITGPMASGKSSVIDAIVWCLYGRTARYGADSKGVISAGENFCEVALDFTLGSRWFRAVRRTGKTTESGLSEREGEEWIQDTSGSEQLTKRIEALLGLDFASFTKTVILPQGSYAEFLLSEPNKRRELLARILELGVYSRVAERAKEMAGQAKVQADTIRDTLSQYLSVSREQVRQRRAEWETLAQQISKTSSQEGLLLQLVEKVDAVTGAASRVAASQAAEQVRQEERELAGQKFVEAEARVTSLVQTVAQTTAERATLGYDAHRHEVTKRAGAHLRDHAAARHTAEEKYQALAQIRHEIAELTRSIAEQEQQVVAAQRTHQERAGALQVAIATGGDVAVLTENLAAARRWKELQHEQARLTAQQQTLSPQLDSVQRSLVSLVQQEAMKEQKVRELTQQRDQVREQEQEKARLELEAGHLGKELQEAVREEKRVMAEADAARTALPRAEAEAQKQQDAVVRAERQEQTALMAVEERRRQHEVAHVRAALQVGDPCPVCQVLVRELPSPLLGMEVDLSGFQPAVDAARTTLTQTRQTFQNAQVAVAAARTRQETAEQAVTERAQKRQEAQERFVARFPGFPSLSAALNTLQTQRQELAAQVRELETRAQTIEKEKQALSRQREKAQQEEAKVTEELRGIAVTLGNGTQQLASLAPVLTGYVSANEDPETVLTARRHALLQAEQEVKALEQQHHQATQVLTSLTTNKLQKEGKLGVLASQHTAALAQAEREALAVRAGLNLAADVPLPDIIALEGELRALGQKQAQHAALLQREESLRREQEQTGRQAAALQADLQACEREFERSRQERVAAEHELERVRAELRVAVQQSGLPDLGPEGEGVRERRTAVHEQTIAFRDRRSRLDAEILALEQRCTEKEQEQEKLRAAETAGRLATDLHKLLGAEFTDFLSQGAVEALMRDATVHLQRLTHGRYAFDIAYKRRAIELQIVDHEDMKRARPTHSLSGGETFLASLAIALALAQGFREVATGKAAKTSTECLILDEGFGTLDREGLQLVTETLQELRGEEGRMVGIITHVEEVAAAMPIRIAVRKGSRTSTIMVGG